MVTIHRLSFKEARLGVHLHFRLLAQDAPILQESKQVGFFLEGVLTRWTPVADVEQVTSQVWGGRHEIHQVDWWEGVESGQALSNI